MKIICFSLNTIQENASLSNCTSLFVEKEMTSINGKDLAMTFSFTLITSRSNPLL